MQQNERLEYLLEQMTLAEKVGQMTQLDITLINTTGKQRDIELNVKKVRKLIREHHIGSFLNGEAVSATVWFRFMDQLTRTAMEESRLKIPIIYGIDHIHGASYLEDATIFPQAINLGATFNPEHARQTGAITAMECADLGHHWCFSPVLDLGVNPLWPRFFETYGEDPLLASRLGEAFVRGMQETTESEPYRVAATGKHFLGYSNPRSGWDRTPALLSMQEIHEFHRPSFQRAIDAGLHTIMINSGEINGIPVHASPVILSDLLRHKMGFEGVIVTDWDDIGKLVDFHFTAENFKEATFDAIQAGIDMSMTPLHLKFNKALIELVQEGRITEERINESVRRILKLKSDLGLFEHPFPRNDRFHRIGSADNRALARKAATESLVLLKNEGDILPLDQPRRIGVFGMAASTKRTLCGGWTIAWQGGTDDRYPVSMPTIKDALQEAFPHAQVDEITADEIMGAQIHRSEVLGVESMAGKQAGSAINADKPTVDDHAAETRLSLQLNAYDVLIYAGGELPYCEFAGNISDLSMPADQVNLIQTIRQHSKAPLIMVLVQGRPRLINQVSETADAILFAGLPGFEGARAIADILSGKATPSGKLPFSYPMESNHHLVYNHKRSNLYFYYPEVANQIVQGDKTTALYPFGHGLSYTTFAYTALKLSGKVLSEHKPIRATVTITNTGARTGTETVLWFTSTLVGKITRPVRELRHFEKVTLQPGESARVHFDISPDMLAYPDENGEKIAAKGKVRVMVAELKATVQIADNPSRDL